MLVLRRVREMPLRSLPHFIPEFSPVLIVSILTVNSVSVGGTKRIFCDTCGIFLFQYSLLPL